MIRTTRCRRCGQVLDAFVESVPGLPMALSQQAVESRLESARIRHLERCPGPRERERPTKKKLPREQQSARQPQPVRARRRLLPAVWGRRREAG